RRIRTGVGRLLCGERVGGEEQHQRPAAHGSPRRKRERCPRSGGGQEVGCVTEPKGCSGGDRIGDPRQSVILSASRCTPSRPWAWLPRSSSPVPVVRI